MNTDDAMEVSVTPVKKNPMLYQFNVLDSAMNNKAAMTNKNN